MSDLTEILTSPENGDSGGEVRLCVEQITAIPGNYSKATEESLLKELWENKSGKRDINFSHGLYVELPTQYPININAFVADYLRAIDEYYFSYKWSIDFGRVIVGISDRSNKTQFLLRNTNDPESRAFNKVSGGTLIEPASYIIQDPKKMGSNLITINSAETTIDGLLIELTHMIDELVYQRAFDLGEGRVSSEVYKKATSLIFNEGVYLQFDSTINILETYSQSKANVRVRLYGNKHSVVPYVMGYVVSNLGPNTYSLKREKSIIFESTDKKPEIPKVSDVEVLIGITPAKAFHTGHVLLYLVANSFAQTFGKNVTIAMNNSGPRISETANVLSTRIAEKAGLKVTGREIEQLLSVLSLEFIDSLYKSRSDIDSNEIEIPEENITALRFAAEQNIALLARLGLFPNYFFDSEINSFRLIDEAFRSEAGYLPQLGVGYGSLETGRAVNYLQDSKLNGTGASIASYLSLFRENKDLGVLYVDQDLTTSNASKLLQYELGLPAFQVSGAAIGFAGEIASGTKGNSLQIVELSQMISDISNLFELETTNGLNIVMKALQYSLFNTYYISKGHPNNPLVEPFYDFKSKDSFRIFLTNQVYNYLNLRSKIDAIFSGLESDSLEPIDQKIKNEVMGKTMGILNLRPERLIQKLKEQKIMDKNLVTKELFYSHGYNEEESESLLKQVKRDDLMICFRSHVYTEFLQLVTSLNPIFFSGLTAQEKINFEKALVKILQVF